MYYKSGQISAESIYKNDKLEGLYKGYYENGGIEYIDRYRNGEKTSRRMYGSRGNLEFETTYDVNEEVKSGAIGTGTGFALCKEGVIVTAFHVVSGADKVEVRFQDNEWLDATLLKHSRTNDIAVLKVDKDFSSCLDLVSTGALEEGSEVFTIGYPAIGVLGDNPKYTEGTVSSLSGIQNEDSLIQISVPVQPGNSGGPLLNRKGEVVGVITSTAAVELFYKYTGSLPQNISWAIKSDYVRLLLEDDKGKGSKESGGSLVDRVKSSICLIKATSN